MYVYVYVYMYVYITHTITRLYIYIYIYMYICITHTITRLYIYIYICICIYVYVYITHTVTLHTTECTHEAYQQPNHVYKCLSNHTLTDRFRELVQEKKKEAERCGTSAETAVQVRNENVQLRSEISRLQVHRVCTTLTHACVIVICIICIT